MLNIFRKSQVKLLNKKLKFYIPQTTSAHASKLISKVLAGKEYPIPAIAHYKPATIVDIGAHVGAFSVYCAHTYPHCTIACFEPSQRNLSILRKNTQNLPQISIFPFALGKAETKITCYLGKDSSGLTDALKVNQLSSNIPETVTMHNAGNLFSFIKKKNISILKIDTEGCEVDILNAINNSLNAIDIIFLEFHSEKKRIAIDAIIRDTFSLFHANVHTVHRGTLGFIHNRLASSLNETDQEII